VRLSRILRNPDAPAADHLGLRSIVLWTLVGLAIVVGLVLYFRYERTLTPLIG
jgi:type VI protein secretion system component VasF